MKGNLLTEEEIQNIRAKLKEGSVAEALELFLKCVPERNRPHSPPKKEELVQDDPGFLKIHLSESVGSKEKIK